MLKKLAITAALFLSTSITCAAETWKVTSLEWQPFAGKTLPEGGAGIAVLRAALKAEGVDLEVEYLPWTRAIDTGKDPKYVGVFPCWPEDVVEGYSKSAVIFKSPVGFVEPKSKPLVWEKLDDLKGKKIGVVQDYGNTPEFMKLVKSGVILTEVVLDDGKNILKVAAGRVDGAFIDLNNLSYLLKYDAKESASKVQANKKVVDTKDLLLGINNNFKGAKVEEILKRGLSKIDPDKIIKEYLKKHNM
jgi:polar amino acid transport system substrate-binding protein